MDVKPEHSWLEGVLFTLRMEGPIGDSERRHWADPTLREFYKSLWKEAPRWFREAARPYLGKNYQARPGPKGMMNSEIMSALEHFAGEKK